MRILVTTMVLMVGMMFATTGIAEDEAEKATDATEGATEEMPAVQAAPPETQVAIQGPIDADAGDASIEAE